MAEKLVRALVLVMVVAGGPRLSAEIIDRVMAVVGGQVITLSDTQAAIRLGLVSTERVQDATAAAVDRLVERALMLVEVDRYAPPEPEQEAIAARLGAAAHRFPGAQGFTDALSATGYSETRLREFLRNDLRIEAYLEQRFAATQLPERRRALIAEWLDSLKRRAEITVLYLPGR